MGPAMVRFKLGIKHSENINESELCIPLRISPICVCVCVCVSGRTAVQWIRN